MLSLLFSLPHQPSLIARERFSYSASFCLVDPGAGSKLANGHAQDALEEDL
jgi:hypothetical protein